MLLHKENDTKVLHFSSAHPSYMGPSIKNVGTFFKKNLTPTPSMHVGIFYLTYMRHYNPRFVYFIPYFSLRLIL